MMFPRLQFRLYTWFFFFAGGAVAVAEPGSAGSVLPADFLERMVQADQSLRFSLPDGRRVVGTIEEIQRTQTGIARLRGKIAHPEAGEFAFEREHADGLPEKLSGHLRFASRPNQWSIVEDKTHHGFRMVETPAEDSFKPAKMEMPTADRAHPPSGMSREQAEATLRKDLKIEKSADGKLRVGVVELDKMKRAIRFPATVNMTSGTIEYALVATSGKSHEAMFTTDASPRDIHLAMLLLGIQPAKFAPSADKGLIVPATAAVEVSVGWETNGAPVSHPLASLTKVADVSADRPAAELKSDRPWLYNGSRFSGAGFGALLEGSIISLIADEMALVNNSQSDRDNDEIHIPNTSLLPAKGIPVTIMLRPGPSSSQKPDP